MKIGQVVKFRIEILDIAKPNTPIGNTVDMFKGETMIISDFDKYGFIKINNKDLLINPLWIEGK